MTTHRVQVTIYQQEYTLKGEGPEERIRRLASMVDQRMWELARRYPQATAQQLAILTALHLAEELDKLSQEHERALGLLEKAWARQGEAGKGKGSEA
ncbi:MAG: cell division protein ZapA [Clostridiales bacterium]|nr:cell division protein ZapA [Clostridiales bacterium]